MKTGSFSIAGLTAAVVALFLGCNKGNDTLYLNLRTYADNIKVINTHEHQHFPHEVGDYRYGFFQLLAKSYLAADLASSNPDLKMPENAGSLSSDKLWDVLGHSLDLTRNTSYYSQFLAGFRKLYGFSDPYFTKDNVRELSAEIEKKYENYNEWFDSACLKAGFELMFNDHYWKPTDTVPCSSRFVIAFNINFMISEAGSRPARLAGSPDRAEAGGKTIGLDEYLESCDELFRIADRHAVCLKNSQAYSRSLYYEDVSYDEAKMLFKRQELTSAETKKIEDFMFHYIISKAIEYDLPIQIHTGYLAGNGNTLENSNPLNLNNLFLKYRNAKFILFHGGFPWTGECASMAKMFPNVYLDLVWLPQISRQQAISSLDVMLDCVPYNKFCWGGDCHFIEESAGSLEFGKDVVSEVLVNRVKRGLMTEDVAREILERIFRLNAMEIFDNYFSRKQVKETL